MLGTNGPLGRIENDTIELAGDGPEDVQAAVRQADGTLWQALPTGLRRSGGGRPDRLFTAADGLPSPNVTALTLDRRGGLWIGTSAGVARLRRRPPRRRARSVRDADYEGMFVTALLEDREGSIWVGDPPRRPAPACATCRSRPSPATKAAWPTTTSCRSSRITRPTSGSAPTAPA